MAELTLGGAVDAAPAEESDFSPRKMKIAFACAVGLMLAGGGFAQAAIALIMLPLQHDFGWSRGAIGLGLTLMTWAGALAAPLAGRYVDKRGARRMLIWTALGITAVTAALGFSTRSILQFYACFILLGLLGASAVGYIKIISALFSRHRGKAFALFMVEATVVMAIMPPLMNLLMPHGEWRGLFLWLAAIKLVVAIPIMFIWIKDPVLVVPDQMSATLSPPVEGLTMGEAFRSYTFWMILAGNVGGGLTIYGLFAHLVGMMNAHGLSRGAAVGALSFLALFTALGQFSSGFVLDKVQSSKIASAYLVLFAIGIFLISQASAQTGVLPLYIGVALMGLGGGAQEPMRNYFFTRYFGLRSFAEITSWFRSIQAVLTAPAPWIVGVMFDRTHSYAFAFILFGAGCISSIVLFALLPAYRFGVGAPLTAPAKA